MTDGLIDAREIKGGREEIRVEFSSYRGFDYLNVRKWWRDSDGTFKPGKGLTIRPTELPWLRAALVAAEEVAIREGLVDEESYEAIGLPVPPGLTEAA